MAIKKVWILVPAVLLAIASGGCDSEKRERCDQARREAGRSWQAYEGAARDRVNDLDDEAALAGRAAVSAAVQAELESRTDTPMLELADILAQPAVPEADAGASAAVGAATGSREAAVARAVAVFVSPVTDGGTVDRASAVVVARNTAIAMTVTVEDAAT
ncbi:MAG: hypothetical protein WCJ30_07720, partial [Deltaproteobacteria bacterium]